MWMVVIVRIVTIVCFDISPLHSKGHLQIKVNVAGLPLNCFFFVLLLPRLHTPHLGSSLQISTGILNFSITITCIGMKSFWWSCHCDYVWEAGIHNTKYKIHICEDGNCTSVSHHCTSWAQVRAAPLPEINLVWKIIQPALRALGLLLADGSPHSGVG